MQKADERLIHVATSNCGSMLKGAAASALTSERGVVYHDEIPTSQLSQGIFDLQLDIVIVELNEDDGERKRQLELYRSILALRPTVSFLAVKEASGQFFFLELCPTIREVTGEEANRVAAIMKEWRALGERKVVHA